MRWFFWKWIVGQEGQGIGIVAQVRNQDRQCHRERVVDLRRMRLLRRSLCALNQRLWQNVSQQCIIKTGEKRNDRQIVQKRQIAADNEKDLEQNHQRARNVARGSRYK